jgi:hypothetical protein
MTTAAELRDAIATGKSLKRRKRNGVELSRRQKAIAKHGSYAAALGAEQRKQMRKLNGLG